MAGLTAVKFSIAFQYKRMFITPGFQRYVKLLFVVLTIYGLFLAFSTIISCWPVRFYWTRVRPNSGSGQCLPFDTMFFVYTGLNIMTDIMIVASPLPVLARMHLPVRQKMSLFALFTIGGTLYVVIYFTLSAPLFSIITITTFNFTSLIILVLIFESSLTDHSITIISIIKLFIFRSADLSSISDTTIKNIPLSTWSSIEISVAIICSCIPSLKPLVKPLVARFCPSLLS